MRTITCPKCKQTKGRNFFHQNISRANGLQCYCKECSSKRGKEYLKANRETLRRKAYKYNIKMYWPELNRNEAHKEYIKLAKSQQNKCAICFKKAGSRRLAIDHDHKTGKVRGLLCSKCNRALGYLNDDKELLRKAIIYLEK